MVGYQLIYHFSISLKKINCIFGKRKIDNLLSEHVLEHLSEEDGTIALNNIYFYLKKMVYVE